MVDDSHVVIKINYQKNDKKIKQNREPDMVTEWHIQRILIALILFVIFIILPFYFLDNDEPLSNLEDNVKVKESIKPVLLPEKKPENIDVIINSRHSIKSVDNSLSVSSPTVDKVDKVNKNVVIKDKTFSSISTDKRIVRAQLTSGVKNKEPLGNISLPVKVTENAATGVFYFTEIINMKGQYLYHIWSRNEKVIFKRKINIMGNRWRATTRKLIPFSKAGKWNVSLVDNNNVILNKIQFEVIKE